MKKGKFMLQCGLFTKGTRFQAAPDSETPGMSWEIIETKLKDSDGFPAVKIKFADGIEEIIATLILADAIDNLGCTIIIDY